MTPTRYIISQSSIDLVSTLNHFERYRADYDVKIIVSSTAENYEFLRSVGIPASALSYLDFASRRQRLRNLVRYLGCLWGEKKALKRVAEQIRQDPAAEVIFHSWHMDPHSAYLVSLVCRSHKVTLVDTLAVTSERIGLRDLMSMAGAKTVLAYMLFRAFFGPIFFVAGSRDHQFICFDVKRLPIVVKPKSEAGTPASLQPYLYTPRVEGRAACLTYRDPWGVDDATQAAIYQSMVDTLIRAGYRVLVKVHPQSSVPSFFDRDGVTQIPKYVPFELIDLSKISLVVGLSGASLLSTGAVPTVSFLKMVYAEGSGYYEWEMSHLGRKESIVFVRSVEEFEHLIDSLPSKPSPNAACRSAA